MVSLDRKYYGWKLAAYITGVLFVTMVLAGILIDLLFTGLDRLFPAAQFIPAPNPHLLEHVTTFSFDYTAALNILALIVVAVLVYINIKHPMSMHMDHSGQHMDEMDASERPDGQVMGHEGHAM